MVKRDIHLTGRTEGDDPCPACMEGHEFFEDKQMEIPAEKLSYKETQIDSPEGEKIAEEKNIKKMPHIEDCATYETDCTEIDGKKSCKTETKCRTVTGFDPRDWSDLDELKEAPAQEAPKDESK